MAAVNCEEFGGLLILRIAGSLTLDHAEEWARALSVAWRARFPHILVDLSETEYLDTAGVALLICALQRARRESRKFTVVGWGSQSLKVLRLINLHDSLAGIETEWSMEGAAADCVPGWTKKTEVVQ
jgi:anti-anti-sigma factor